MHKQQWVEHHALSVFAESLICAQIEFALNHSIPFVIRSGGHSEYSTVASPGIIVDLSDFSSVEVSLDNETALLTGSIRTGAVAAALAERNLFTALPNNHSIGAIPYFLGGGNSLVNSSVGYASDQIVSAHVITAKGELVIVSETENAALLYAIRGAGTSFGVVTELVVRVHPFSLLGNPAGQVWNHLFAFPLDRTAEALDALLSIVHDSTYHTAGSIMIGAPPPAFQPAFVVSLRLMGHDVENLATQAFKPLIDLNPLVAKGGKTRIDHLADALEPLNVHGDFKRLRLAGMHSLPKEQWLEVPALWKELVTKCPDAQKTCFLVGFDSRPPKQPNFESAMGMHDIQLWATNLVWYSDAANRQFVDGITEKFIGLMRGGQAEEQWRDLPSNQEAGLEMRYPGTKRWVPPCS